MKWCLRVPVAVALCWCALVEVAEAFARRTCNLRVDGDWFLLIADSSSKEIGDFFRVYDTAVAIGLIAVFLLWAIVIGFSLFARRRCFWGFLAVVLAYVGWNCRSIGHFKTWDPVYVAYDTVRSTRQYAELLSAGRYEGPGGSEDLGSFEGAASERPKRPILAYTNLVVVIGESVTTDRMSLYGYGKKTTPQIEAQRDEMTVMGPVRPNWPDTVRSLRMMLTRASEEHPEKAIETSAVAFRKRGYRPVFIGAQPQWGRFCGVEHMIFAACEERLYIGEQGVQPDEALIDYLKREMDYSRNGPFVVFLQMNGSHFPPTNRVPPWFKTPADLDDYDKTVLYMDDIVAKMIKLLPPRTALVYLSDHGESPNSPNWRNVDDPSMWKVPVIIYPRNDGLRQIRRLDEVFGLLLEVCGFDGGTASSCGG